MTITMTEAERDQLAQETAEYIANVLIPATRKLNKLPGAFIHFLSDTRPPTDVAEIKAALLDGRIWISWLDGDRVEAAMHRLHGEPTPGLV